MVHKSTIASAASGGGAVSSVSNSDGTVTVTPTTGDVVVSLPTTGVTPSSYTNTNLTVDAEGRITAASNGAAGSGGVGVSTFTGDGTVLNNSASSGAVTASLATHGAHTFLAGPVSGGAVAPTFRAIIGSDLPAPSAVSLGGVLSIAQTTSNWIQYIDTAGAPHLSQPAFTDITGTAAVSQGGTGLATLTAHAVMLGEGVANVAFATTGQSSRILIDQGVADPLFKPVSGDAAITASGALTVLQVHGVVYGASPATNTVPVVTSSNTTTYEAVPNAALANSSLTVTAGVGLTGGGSIALGASATISLATPVAIAQGGTNQIALTAHSVLIGEGSSTGVGFATIGTGGRLLVDQGANLDPAFVAMAGDASINSAGTITVAKVDGVAYGTNPATNTVPVVTSSNTVTYETVPNAALANSSVTYTAGVGLTGGGTVALGSSATISLATPVSIANGGTNQVSLTANAVLLGEGASTGIGFATIGTGGRLLIDQGAGADPSFKAMSQDASINSAGVITVTKTNNVAFAASATTDTTNATNINSGLLASARISGNYNGIGGVGTITTGTWNGSIIGAQWGGTGVNGSSAATGALLIGNGTGYTLANLTAGSNVTIQNAAGAVTISAVASAGSVSSVTNTDGSFTIAPNVGAVIASLNTSHTNSWLATQNFSNAGAVSIYNASGAMEEALYNNGNSGASPTIVWNNGNLQKVTVSAVATFAFTAPTNPGRFTLLMVQDGTGHAITMPAIKWPSGTQPTWSSAATKIDILSLMWDGSTYYGIGQTAFA